MNFIKFLAFSIFFGIGHAAFSSDVTVLEYKGDKMTQTYYYHKDMAKIVYGGKKNGGKSTFLYRGPKELYMIQHDEKSYIGLKQMKMLKMRMQGMMGKKKRKTIKFSLGRKLGTEKVAGVQSTKYEILKDGKKDSVTWLADKSRVGVTDAQLKVVLSLMDALQDAMGTGMKGLREIFAKGVMTKQNGGMQDITLVKASKKSFKDSDFVVPKGYKSQKMPGM